MMKLGMIAKTSITTACCQLNWSNLGKLGLRDSAESSRMKMKVPNGIASLTMYNGNNALNTGTVTGTIEAMGNPYGSESINGKRYPSIAAMRIAQLRSSPGVPCSNAPSIQFEDGIWPGSCADSIAATFWANSSCSCRSASACSCCRSFNAAWKAALSSCSLPTLEESDMPINLSSLCTSESLNDMSAVSFSLPWSSMLVKLEAPCRSSVACNLRRRESASRCIASASARILAASAASAAASSASAGAALRTTAKRCLCRHLAACTISVLATALAAQERFPASVTLLRVR
mmetsp:Transcript_4346/g.7431  ORF Transcript_4346/g.7431 Transcript_4346/m.7431 type:complete len:290 (+) Transcript_4346:213-1082(+)